MEVFIALVITLVVAGLSLGIVLILNKKGFFPFRKMKDKELDDCYITKKKYNKK